MKAKQFISRLLVLTLCIGLLSAVPAHAADSGGLNGSSGKWADFDESVYDEVVFVSTIKNMKVNGYVWPSSGKVLLEVQSSTYTLTGSKPNCIGITIPGGLVVDIYKYYQSAGMSEPVYALLGHFDTRDGNPYTIGSSSSGGASTTPTTVAGFQDVRSTDHYANAVQWAKEAGVTNGTSATAFTPNATVTRAQAVTFLWRAMGKPEPSSANSPFTDVTNSDAYYYKAVLWAAEKGITNGVSSTLFGVNGTLNYDHILAFLCRAAGGNASGSNWSASAVAWAKEKGVSQGLTFSPKSGCPRSNVVYFLWKQLSGKTYPVEEFAEKQTTVEQPDQVPVGLSDQEGARAAIINGFLEKKGNIPLSSFNVEASALREMAYEIADKDGENPYGISILACNEQAGRRALNIQVTYLMGIGIAEYETNEEIRRMADEVVKQVVTSGMDEFETAKALHDWVVLNCKYDKRLYTGNMPDISYTAYGVFEHGTAVCAGYAKAYLALLESACVEAEYVTGNTTRGYHGWNVVKIDGEWYHVDTTWDDPTPDREGYVRYNYFLKSDNYMLNDHGPWSTKKACTSTKYDPILPSSDEVKEQQKLEAAVQAKVQEIISLCINAIETSDADDVIRVGFKNNGVTTSEDCIEIAYSLGSVRYEYFRDRLDEINAAIRAKHPDCEVVSLGSRYVFIKSETLNKQKQEKEQAKKELQQKEEAKKKEEQEQMDARVQEVEKLIQNAILNTTQKHFQYTFPNEYTYAEISSALARMKKADYSFGDYTGADYSLSYSPTTKVLSINNYKWERDHKAQQEQKPQEQQQQPPQQQEQSKEHQKQEETAHRAEIIEAYAQYFYEKIKSLPYSAQEELRAAKALSESDIWVTIEHPTHLGEMKGDMKYKCLARVKELIGDQYPKYGIFMNASGLRVQRIDIKEELERREEEQFSTHTAELEAALQQLIVDAGKKGRSVVTYSIPDEYTTSEISYVHAKMTGNQNYSFEGIHWEDYTLYWSGRTISIAIRIENLAGQSAETSVEQSEETPAEQSAA